MSDFIEIEGDSVKACVREHESGQPMIVFMPFSPQEISVQKFADLIDQSKIKIGSNAKVCRVCLTSRQEVELKLLNQMGFAVDGYEYALKLKRFDEFSNIKLPLNYSVRKMVYEQDMDAVSILEQKAHAADETSRVNFETEAAITSMRGYYERAASDIGVFVLINQEKIVGVLGFMPDRTRENALHISSVSIALEHQSKGLLFPFIKNCLKNIDRDFYHTVTGVTTTSKLISVAKRCGVEVAGLTVSRFI